jgi:predicted membrane protein
MTNIHENTEFVKGNSFFQVFFHKRFFLACVKPHRKWKLPWKWIFFVITIFLLCWVEVHGNNLLKNKTNFFLAKHGWFSFLNFLLCWVGVHYNIYKTSYNISNISYLNSPQKHFMINGNVDAVVSICSNAKEGEWNEILIR